MTEQLALFQNSDTEQVPGTTYQRSDGVWVAEIFGGWYVGHGKTERAAIESAISAMEVEICIR